MVLELSLSPELEDRLRQEAQRRGVSLDTVTIELLDKHLPHDDEGRRSAAITMLHDWAREDQSLSDEGAAENASVLRALDEHRPSYRKLFGNILSEESNGSARSS
ncbi:MAG TPA: hypothetical protein VFW87_03460 [Pirellulales bacterium]|nr:hypothetical protein [Pirellulales bacterium]